MDIQALSVDTSQAQVQEQAAVQVQATEHDTAKQQAQAEPMPVDPNLGQNVDLTA